MNGIKVLLVSASVVLASCYGQSSRHTPQEAQFSIVLSPPVTHAKIGEPIVVTVTVTNLTDHTIGWSSVLGKDSEYRAFQYDLERGKHPVETTRFHRKITGKLRPGDPDEPLGYDSIPIPHPPGKMFEMKIDLARLYELAEPGEYTLQVNRYDEAAEMWVHSNTITIIAGK
jgi:hypothetical protein